MRGFFRAIGLLVCATAGPGAYALVAEEAGVGPNPSLGAAPTGPRLPALEDLVFTAEPLGPHELVAEAAQTAVAIAGTTAAFVFAARASARRSARNRAYSPEASSAAGPVCSQGNAGLPKWPFRAVGR